MSWANAIPPRQALYMGPEGEKDACGVGFIVDIAGNPAHDIVRDARFLLCNMTHRGASGADIRDGDGAGVMTSMPDGFFRPVVLEQFGLALPPAGQYAVGNVYENPDRKIAHQARAKFEEIAHEVGLQVLCWRQVPRNSDVLGPHSRSHEPDIVQPFVTMMITSVHTNGSSSAAESPFDGRLFERLLYQLRKEATHAISLQKWFYVCSLSPTTIVYKGLLSPVQVYEYFAHDLTDPRFAVHLALVHSRFSTNTFPSWDRAQPMRMLGHNGEINTLRGNKNWMRAREGIVASEWTAEQASVQDINKLFPVVEEHGSDSAALDNVLEFLVAYGAVSLPEAVMMMMPEAWQTSSRQLSDERKVFYQWAATLLEPWDGPALVTFSDGRYVGAQLDRNGLRPCRYYLLRNNRMVCASEVGTIPHIDPSDVLHKGRLKPGRMLLVDTLAGRVVDDDELKRSAGRRIMTQLSISPDLARDWLQDSRATLLPGMACLDAMRQQAVGNRDETEWLISQLDSRLLKDDPRLPCFGYTLEQLQLLVMPMVNDGKEALGSMGNDAPLACLSTQPRLVYDYFRQLFAQVTNPPIDPIREDIVMSVETYLGPAGNPLVIDPSHLHLIRLRQPLLTPLDLSLLIDARHHPFKCTVIDITFAVERGPQGYVDALTDVCHSVVAAVKQGCQLVVLSDRAVATGQRVAISAAVAVGAVHHFLVNCRMRGRVGLVVETGEAREVHHFCVLLAYGADAIVPYLAIEILLKLHAEHALRDTLTPAKVLHNYQKASVDGIKKVMSKMGISTLQSYKGAQIFEILGLDDDVVSRSFCGSVSRIRGAGFGVLAQDAFAMHAQAWPSRHMAVPHTLTEGGEYHWRQGGESHINDPMAIASLQDAVRRKNQSAYEAYAATSKEQIQRCTLRGMLKINSQNRTPVPLDQVEPWTAIVKRFCTGAMSYGSISLESHSALAKAMNTLGGKSNTGEGGEDPLRSLPQADGVSLRSAIKQIASGRFGVTSFYLSDSDELQIKMAQGAKPGEGGELPGHKVSADIAKTRKSTEGVGLISPPPHHDIYSIEDLKQLIYDLKASNPRARVSVKLVSEVGVGVVASGVAKARADHILISGHDGGTGASRWTGIKYAGLPWELGLAETHQTLVLNNLRGRVTLQTDGQIRTGHDVAVACLLGAEEWGFSTTPLIAMGCIMLRKCHLNVCAVGIATQDPELRAKFKGAPEHVINFFYYVAEEMRSIMAQLGFRTVNEMVGRSDCLVVDETLRNAKTQHLDLSPILTPAFMLRPGAPTHKSQEQDRPHHKHKDSQLLEMVRASLETGQPTRISAPIINTDRAVGTTLSYHVSRKYGEIGLPPNTINIALHGSAGQSLGAFLAPGITLELEGDANDYVGKGLSGGRIVIYPPRNSSFAAEDNVIVGNVCLYGATSGQAFFRGIAAERFCVRNSGCETVVEGVGDHGCEYMTGGKCVILGSVGRNFASGMSGGLAYILDADGDFEAKCNKETVDLERMVDQSEVAAVRALIEQHVQCTGSAVGQRVLNDWHASVLRFVKVLPKDYKAVLLKKAATAAPKPQPKVTSLRPLREPQVADLEDLTMATSEAERRTALIDKVRGFKKYKRQNEHYRHSRKRVDDWAEVSVRLKGAELKVQAARCMDCGVPFCQSQTGCPIGNIIPKWNDLVFNEQWKDALERLLLTNNFPEFTGRVCPAPCEGACVLGVTEQPVAIKSIECAIIDRGFEEGWITPQPPLKRTGRQVTIIGSGPAGLAAADQLNKAGHSVTVLDRNDRHGGLLVYGIPNMKLDKRLVQRRIDLMAAEGIKFVANAHVGVSVDARQLLEQSDALLLATGATWPRDLNITNRDLNGIHFAMEFLTKNTKSLLDSKLSDGQYLSAKDKHVVVIGGGDTGCDCIATALRHGAKSIVNFELLPQPPSARAEDNPWPEFPRVFKVDYGHNEVQVMHGKDPRQYQVLSKSFVSDGHGNVRGINAVRVQWSKDLSGRWAMAQVPGSETFYPADLVLLAMGFVGPEQALLRQLGVEQDARQNVKTSSSGKYATSIPRVFAAGDCRRGQSLIVWGIREGREAAREMDVMLTGSTVSIEGKLVLPITGGLPRRDANVLQPAIASTGLVVAPAINA
ncbi:glutamate synthase [NADH] [Sorochytrium milnesiophthora]